MPKNWTPQEARKKLCLLFLFLFYFFYFFTVQPDKSLAFGGCMLICFIHRIINHWLARLSSSNLSSYKGVELFFVLNSFSIFVLSCLWPSSPPFTPVPFIRPWWKTISCSRRSTRAETRSLTLTLTMSLSLVEKRGDQLTSYPPVQY